MASFNVRYGGNIIALQEGFNYNASYGTAKLNLKVNSISTLKLGLTTNTNAKDYCKFQMRIGGQTAFIGRVSSTSYISGANVDYNGSSTVSRSQSVSTASEVKQSAGTSAFPITTSSMSTSTGQYTQVTRTYTQSGTNGAGNGSGTAAANPTVRTVTNATGSSVTTRTASANVASATIYSHSRAYRTIKSTYNRQTTRYNTSFEIYLNFRNIANSYQTLANSAASGYSVSYSNSFITAKDSRGAELATKITSQTMVMEVITLTANAAIKVRDNFYFYYKVNTTSGTYSLRETVSGTLFYPTTQYIHHYNYLLLE